MEKQNEILMTISEWSKTQLCIKYKVSKGSLYRAMHDKLITPVCRPLSGRGILFNENEIRRFMSLRDKN
jgi:hypothetical protein